MSRHCGCSCAGAENVNSIRDRPRVVEEIFGSITGNSDLAAALVSCSAK